MANLLTNIVTLIVLSIFLLGCTTIHVTEPAPAQPSWQVYTGQGQARQWRDILQQAQQADIILLGERHNDAVAHQLQAQLIQAILNRTPNAAVAMEMFEQNEQDLVDLYLDGHISQESLMETTDADAWGGEQKQWHKWYQPIVDAVKKYRAQGAALIAANAPRNYVRLARLEDFAALQKLQQAGKTYFSLPPSDLDQSAYQQRFIELMSPKSQESFHGTSIDPIAYFRSQQIWDASMAEAVAAAHAQHPKVLLVVGNFHIRHQGGTLLHIRHTLPQAKILSISIRPQNPLTPFQSEDQEAADFVIYTSLQ